MLQFLDENKEWLFSGIGVTVLIWLFARIKVLFERVIAKSKWTEGKIKSIQNQFTEIEPKYMTIENQDGSEEKAEVLLTFEFTDTKKEYVIYTQHETDRFGNVTIYVSELERGKGEATLSGVKSNREWSRIRHLLKVLSESDQDQPIFDEYGVEII